MDLNYEYFEIYKDNNGITFKPKQLIYDIYLNTMDDVSICEYVYQDITLKMWEYTEYKGWDCVVQLNKEGLIPEIKMIGQINNDIIVDITQIMTREINKRFCLW